MTSFSAAEKPRLEILQTNGYVTLTWPDPAYGLYAGPAVDGSYTNVSGATNPHTLPASERQLFFRLGPP